MHAAGRDQHARLALELPVCRERHPEMFGVRRNGHSAKILYETVASPEWYYVYGKTDSHAAQINFRVYRLHSSLSKSSLVIL
jgi:hypothetical protein